MSSFDLQHQIAELNTKIEAAEALLKPMVEAQKSDEMRLEALHTRIHNATNEPEKVQLQQEASALEKQMDERLEKVTPVAQEEHGYRFQRKALQADLQALA